MSEPTTPISPSESTTVLSLLCYLPAGSSPTQPPSVMVTEVATGKVWLPAKSAFGAADGSELTPLNAVAGSSPNVAGMFVGTLANFPDARAVGQYVASLHPAGGGAPLAPPSPLAPSSQLIKVMVAVGS